MEYLLIDASYYLFYRYHALLQWWKHANADKEIGKPIENRDFMERFEKVFINKIHEIIKKLKLQKHMIIIGKDCPRKDIWRMDIFDKYKETRVYNEDWEGSAVFQYAYEKELFKKAGAHMIVQHPRLEADDCLALTIKNIRNISPTSKIYIITSDMDYLQLADENTIPINLKFKPLTESKTSFKNKDKDLFCKIVMGDKSDCISGIFKKCGIKTASKYYENPDVFRKKLQETNSEDLFEKNKKLVDFNCIPQKYCIEFNSGKYTTEYVLNNNV